MADDIPLVANAGVPFDFDCKVEGFCSCGAAIKVGYTNDCPTVLHALPMCDLFTSIENPIDYLTRVNIELEARQVRS